MAASTAVAFLESALYPRPHMKAGPRSAAQGPPTWLISCLRAVWPALPQKGGSKVDPGAVSLERLETERNKMWRRQPLGFWGELIHRWSHSPWAFLAPPAPQPLSTDSSPGPTWQYISGKCLHLR